MSNRNEAYVICNNDSIEFVVIGSEAGAIAKLKEMEADYKKRNSHNTNMAYWHIHTVTYEHFSGAS
jgi:hypothetical protein